MANGDRLRYRPRAAMTRELAERIKAHRRELLPLLAEGARLTDEEQRLLADAPAGLRTTVERIKTLWPGVEFVEVRNPRQHLADLIRDARQNDDQDQALNLREAWRERAAVMEYDAGLPRPQAEVEGLADTLRMLRN